VTIHGRFLCVQYREPQRRGANTEMYSSSGKVQRVTHKRCDETPDKGSDTCKGVGCMLWKSQTPEKRHRVVTPLFVPKLSRTNAHFLCVTHVSSSTFARRIVTLRQQTRRRVHDNRGIRFVLVLSTLRVMTTDSNRSTSVSRNACRSIS
jgi:hypothetical protein